MKRIDYLKEMQVAEEITTSGNEITIKVDEEDDEEIETIQNHDELMETIKVEPIENSLTTYDGLNSQKGFSTSRSNKG